MTKTTDISNPAPADTAALPLPWVNVPEFSTKEGAPLELVQLSAVLAWRMQSKNQRFAPAVLALIDDLSGFEGLAVYVVEQSGFARAVVASDTFGLGAVKRRGSRGIDQPLQVVERYPFPNGVTPGISAALFVLRRECDRAGAADSFMAPNSALSCLAVSCKQAAELWGAGASVEAETVTSRAALKPPKVLVKDKTPEWDGERLSKEQTLLKKSAKDYTKQLGIRSGLDETEIRRRIKAYTESLQNPFAELVKGSTRY